MTFKIQTIQPSQKQKVTIEQCMAIQDPLVFTIHIPELYIVSKASLLLMCDGE